MLEKKKKKTHTKAPSLSPTSSIDAYSSSMNYSYYPSPPPYAYVPQWYQQSGNQNGSEPQNTNGFVGNAPGGGTVVPSQTPQQTAEELAALREETASIPHHHDTVPTVTDTQATGIGNDVKTMNGTTIDIMIVNETTKGTIEAYPTIGNTEIGKESAGTRECTDTGTMIVKLLGEPWDRQGQNSVKEAKGTPAHAPIPPRPNPTRTERPLVTSINLATSPHNPDVRNTFDDPMYVTIEEKIAATSLLLYGPTDNLHEDCMWDSNTGACILVGEAMRQITQCNGPVVLPPPAMDSSNHLIETNSESAVDAAEKLMEKANEPGNFNALWTARQLYWQAKRTIHLEEGLGYTSERSTLPSHLRANLQLYVDRRVTWADKPNTQPPVGEPWDTERDPNKPQVPSLATPDLSDTVDNWALWLIVNATTKEHPGITWTQSGHVDLATVQTHLLLHRLIRGIFGTVDVYTERVRTAKKNFVLHFIDMVAIPDLYGQKLSELEIVSDSGEGAHFKANSSLFEESSEVVKHLADCGVSVDDMAEGFAFGQQWILDKTGDIEPHSPEFRRYNNLLKRSRARLQFTHVVPIDDRTWTLPEEWKMEDVVEHRRRKHVQNLYRNQKVLKRDAWRFTRSVPRVGTIGTNALNQLAQGIDDMRI
ncbi:hypothetical protein DFH05DRAFT_1584706 [Lentinula detonsa]|uniref:Uncharacterized protein n=1 Tax=Lentinula detonsa TaxID=2804962 RepID=A0A9W8NS59_9AGAR|nr:hypothetical protein DFH05DRAFT_1584706 [Lentinula detonsa]